MFKVEKDIDGTMILRPMFIGFIKNTLIRRFLMILMWPLTVIATISFNSIMVLFVIAIHLMRFLIHNVKMIFDPPWKHRTWNSPRTKPH